MDKPLPGSCQRQGEKNSGATLPALPLAIQQKDPGAVIAVTRDGGDGIGVTSDRLKGSGEVGKDRGTVY